MKTYKTVIDKKDFKPKDSNFWPISNWRNYKYVWTVKFHEDCRYTLPGNEQKDWLKGGGITKYFTANNRNSIMWAWRYVPEKDQIEIALYINDANKDKKYKSVAFVDLGKEFDIELYLDRKQNGKIKDEIVYTYLTLNVITKEANPTKIKTAFFPLIDIKPMIHFYFSRKIGLWFGGTLPANKVMHVDVNYKKTKIEL